MEALGNGTDKDNTPFGIRALKAEVDRMRGHIEGSYFRDETSMCKKTCRIWEVTRRSGPRQQISDGGRLIHRWWTIPRQRGRRKAIEEEGSLERKIDRCLRSGEWNEDMAYAANTYIENVCELLATRRGLVERRPHRFRVTSRHARGDVGKAHVAAR
ncbi:hypothetical protein P4O66_002244 [Electrophorus voltai]|uniref:Uncharacterized protein n=1 Tax=Electrophorus voltai TaxID=2609070 RepID=A0AAD9DS87_9TELE|nr:hypothetical protein P4O66_002244 [Electrophorus voltai]